MARLRVQWAPGINLENRPPLRINFFIEDFVFFAKFLCPHKLDNLFPFCSSTNFCLQNLRKNLI